MKKLIWTSGSNDIGSLLIQWIISLRTLGKYSGDIVILDYGLSDQYKDICKYFGAKLKSISCNGFIVNHRYIDIIDVLKTYQDNDYIAHFDADIWFQKDIDLLFQLIEQNPDGCVFSPDVDWYSQSFLGTDNSLAHEYHTKRDRIKNIYGGTIQGGFSAGLNKHIIYKYGLFQQLLDKDFIRDSYGSDQFAFNLLFDFNKDTANAHLLNCVGADIVCNNGIWFSKKYSQNLQECIGIHIVGMLRKDIHRYFKYRYIDILINSLESLNFKNNSINTIYLEELPISRNSSIIEQLLDIINMCQNYHNSSLTIGFKENEKLLCATDVGCTGLIPLNHGNLHYWDRLNISRRQHIAHPNKLFLSNHAVKTISKIDKDYPKILCNKFEYNWLDFMLSMMLIQHNLSYSLIL